MNNEDSPYQTRPEHKQTVEIVCEQLPDILGPQNFGIVDELWRVRSKIDDLRKQAWILEVDRWLREDAQEGDLLQVVFDRQDRRYCPEEDSEDMRQDIQDLMETLDNIEIENEDFCSKACKRLNEVHWEGTKARAVLASLAEGLGIDDGMAWMDAFSAAVAQQSMEQRTAKPQSGPRRPGRI